jgi:hypothetical protein
MPGPYCFLVGIIENRSMAGQPHDHGRMLKKSASRRSLLFGLSGLSGFLVERNKPDKPNQPAGSCSLSCTAA